MNKKNTVFILLLLIGGYFILKNKNKKKGGIIVLPSTPLKPFAKKNKMVYDSDLNTPIYTFTEDTQINILDYNKITGIYKIEFNNGILRIGFINNDNIIFK